MPNYHRAFVPGGCWFFTVDLLERRQTLLVHHRDVARGGRQDEANPSLHDRRVRAAARSSAWRFHEISLHGKRLPGRNAVNEPRSAKLEGLKFKRKQWE